MRAIGSGCPAFAALSKPTCIMAITSVLGGMHSPKSQQAGRTMSVFLTACDSGKICQSVLFFFRGCAPLCHVPIWRGVNGEVAECWWWQSHEPWLRTCEQFGERGVSVVRDWTTACFFADNSAFRSYPSLGEQALRGPFSSVWHHRPGKIKSPRLSPRVGQVLLDCPFCLDTTFF